MVSSKSSDRLTLRLTPEMLDYINVRVEQFGISKKEYILNAISFYDEYHSELSKGHKPHADIMSNINKRSDEIVYWTNKLSLKIEDFYIDAIRFYLDALILSNGQPDTQSLLTLTTLLRSVSAQLDSIETKTDTLTNIAINGFSSFSRISSGASYLIDNIDDGLLPESRTRMD